MFGGFPSLRDGDLAGSRLQADTIKFWPQLFEGCMDNAIHRIKIPIQGIAWFILLTLIHWRAIYLVDSVIQPLPNNWGLVIRPGLIQFYKGVLGGLLWVAIGFLAIRKAPYYFTSRS